MLTICELFKPFYIKLNDMLKNAKSCKSDRLQDFDILWFVKK